MAWNKPGGDGNEHDPWGGGNKNQSPPDLDKILTQFFNKLRAFFNLKKKPPSNWQPSSLKEYGFGGGIIALVLVVAWFISGLFIVNPAEEAVILRLGQYTDVAGPGLHWMARFIDTKYLVDVQKINSFALQGDFLTKSSEQGDLPNQYVSIETKAPAGGNAVMTDSSDKSKNLVDVEMTVQYRISDPRAFLFNVVDPDSTIQEVAAGALSDVVGKMKLDDVLTTGREMLSSGVLERTKQVLASYNAGLEVTAVTLRKVQAPDQVQVAFNDVNRADQDKATYVQQAQAYASKVVPLAQGVAARILADATAYQQQSILGAQAQVAKYEALLSAYKTAPDLMRERMYLETMQTVFQNTSKILVDANTGNNILYLPIDKVMQAAREEEASADNTNAANQSATSLATAQAQVSDAASTQSSTNSDQSAGTEVK
jgi:membrane protease subunit HflK